MTSSLPRRAPLARAAVALLAFPALAAVAGAQRPDATPRDRRWRFSLGTVTTSDWAQGRGDLAVKAVSGVALGAGLAWPATPGLDAAVSVRGAYSAAEYVDGDEEWSGGSVAVVDAALTFERAVHPRVQLRLGAGGAFVDGPSRVEPFESAGRFAPLAEAGGAFRIGGRWPFALSAGVQALRFGAEGTADAPAKAGTVYRVLLEARHGW